MTKIVGVREGKLLLDDDRVIALRDTHGWQLTSDDRCVIDGGAAMWRVAQPAVGHVVALIDALKDAPGDIRGMGARRTAVGLGFPVRDENGRDVDGVTVEVVRIVRDVDAGWPEALSDPTLRSLLGGIVDAAPWSRTLAHRGALPGSAARFELSSEGDALAVEVQRGGAASTLVATDEQRDEIEVKVFMAQSRVRLFNEEAHAAIGIARDLYEERLVVVHDLESVWWCPRRQDGSLDVDNIPAVLRHPTSTSWTSLPPLLHSARATFNRRVRPDELAALRASRQGPVAVRAVFAAVDRLRALWR